MLQYIYFVKCPHCEDEPFDFFNEAKQFALGCLSKKPIITQTEVDRNDFGECTDSCDLGTVWSWEDIMKETDAEPTISIFTKDDLVKNYDPDNDPEFADLDDCVCGVQCDPAFLRENIQSEINQGDLVDFGTYGQLYVCNPTYSSDYYWVTDLEEDRNDKNASGWSIKKDLAKRIIDSCFDESCKKPIPEGMTIFEEVNSRGGYYVLGYHNNNEYVFWTDPKRFFRSEDDCYTTELTADVVKFQTYEQANAHSNDADEQYRKSTGYDEYYVTIEPYRTGEYVIVGTYESTKKYWNGYEWLDSIDEECIMSERIATEEKRYVDRRVSNISMFKPMYVDSNGNLHDDYQRKPIPEGMTIEQLVEEMEDNEDTVECTWCNDLFDKDQCRKEVNLGYLCSRCEAAIKSRGEKLTFEENNYWDFLDESASSSTKPFDPKEEIEFEYENIEVTVELGRDQGWDDYYGGWDELIEKDLSGDFTYEVDALKVASVIWEEFLDDDLIMSLPGGPEAMECDRHTDEASLKFWGLHFEDLLKKYYDKLLEFFREDALEAAKEEFANDYLEDDYPDNYFEDDLD